MKKKLFPFRRSAFVIWILSYTVILLISLTANMFIQAQAAQSLKAEIFNTTSALLSQAQYNIDARMNDIAKIALQINWNPNVKQLLYDSSESYPADQYNEISNGLRSFQASNSFIERIFIFPNEKDTIVTQGATIPGSLREYFMGRYRLPDGSGISKLLFERRYGYLVPLTYASPSGEKLKKIAFVQSLPYTANKSAGTLMILIDNTTLLSSMNVGGWLDDNFVFVLDESDNILTTNASFELPEDLRYGALTSQPDRFSIDIARERYTVMQASSGVNEWKYIFLLPERVLMKDLNRFTELFSLSITGFLLLGLAVSVVFARRNYFPLRRLTAVFEKESGRLFSRGENEFEFIESAIAATLGKNQTISDTLGKQFIQLRASFLLRLLKNNLGLGASVSEALTTYNIKFISERFVVVMFRISQIVGESLGKSEDQRQRSAQYIVYNVFEELANRTHYGFMVEADGMQAMLLNLSPACETEKDIRASLTDTLQTGISYIEKTFGVSLAVSVSYTKASLGEISQGYTEAYTAMEYDMLMGNAGLTFYGNVELSTAGADGTYYYYYPLQLEIQFSNFIKAGDYDGAKKILDELFRVNFERNTPPQPIIRCFMFNLTSTIMKTIFEISDSDRDGFLENLNAVEMLLNCQSVTEINMKLNQILIDLCEYTRAAINANNFGAETEAFVESNYANPSLDITMIAEHFAITSSYLSKKFKSGTGMSLLDFINKTRINRAKEALAGTGNSIADIASACGFVNSNTFIRVFKKYEGVTPGRYREIARDA